MEAGPGQGWSLGLGAEHVGEPAGCPGRGQLLAVQLIDLGHPAVELGVDQAHAVVCGRRVLPVHLVLGVGPRLGQVIPQLRGIADELTLVLEHALEDMLGPASRVFQGLWDSRDEGAEQFDGAAQV